MKKIATVLATVATLALVAANTWAAPKSVYCQGKILEVAEDGKSMTVQLRTPKKADKITVQFPERKIAYYLYMPGDVDDLKEDVWVKTYGKVADDRMSAMGVHRICVLPSKSTYVSNGRIDGQLAIRDGKYFLKRGDREAALLTRPDVKVTYIAKASKDEVKPGVDFAMNALDKEDHYEVYNEMRFHVKRRPNAK